MRSVWRSRCTPANWRQYWPYAGPRRRLVNATRAPTGRKARLRALSGGLKPPEGRRPREETIMSDQPGRPANCEACAFWRKLREHEGICARHAPETSTHPDEAAHWPQTHGWQVVRRRRPCRSDVNRRALRGLRLLAPARGRAPSRQPPRHADGLVGSRGHLRPSRAPPRSRTRTAIVLARDGRHGLLRRGRFAARRGASIALMREIGAPLWPPFAAETGLSWRARIDAVHEF